MVLVVTVSRGLIAFMELGKLPMLL